MSKYHAYPEYKDSGVEWLGDIPSNWKLCRLKFLAKIKNGQDYKSVEAEEGYPVIGSGGQFTYASQFTYNRESVLLGRKGTIDKPLYINEPFWTVDTMYYTEINGDVYPKYLYYLALTIQFGRYSTNTALPSMTQEHLGNYFFAVPSGEIEKKIIANFLDHETAKIDTLIEKQQQLIQLLKEKRQAVISHAVTKGLSSLNSGLSTKLRESGIEWLGEVPDHWRIGKVKNLASIISKGTTPSTMGSDFESTGIRFLKAENVGKEFYVASQPEFYISEKTDEQLSRSRLQSHDVLVIIAGATTGQSSVMQEDLLPANTNQAVSFIRPASSSYSSYISFWLSTEYAQSKIWQVAVQAAQPNLSMESLGNIYIPIPPEHELDELVANINFRILQLSRLTESAELAINLMQERRTALISAAVTGKIDVRDWVAPQASPTLKEVAA